MRAQRESGYVNEPMPDVPESMRALVLSGTGFEHLRIESVPTPAPEAGQLLARVDAAGVCTSLVKLIEQGSDHTYLYGWDPSAHPLILGDEGSITIMRVGEDLRDRYEVGGRYVVQPAVEHPPIRHRDRYAHVDRAHKLGVGYTLPGHLAEYMLITEETLEANCLVAVPGPDTPYAHAAMGEPVSCVVSGHEHHVHLEQPSPCEERTVRKGLLQGGVTAVIGAGAMGRMHVDVALGRQPKAVVVIDRMSERLTLTRDLFAQRSAEGGVDLHTAGSIDEAHDLIHALTGHRGADDVIVAAGSRPAAESAHRLCGPGAVLHLFGGFKHGDHMLEMDGNKVHYQETMITGSSGGSPWDLQRTLELMESKAVDLSVHITRIGDLAHVPELIESIKRQELDGKAVIYPHRRTDDILAVTRWTADDERRYLEQP